MSIGDRIKKIRKEYKKSQEEFGKVIGIGKTSVSKLEKGENNPSDQTIILICEKYNIRKEWLVTGKGGMHQYINTDDYSEISTLIGEKDPKAKQAIIDYWNLSEDDKQLFWQFADKFLKGAGN